MKIKVKLYNGQRLPQVIKKGDWIDIYPTNEIELHGPIANTLKRDRSNKNDISFRTVEFNPVFINLGIAMQLPPGYEAHVLPRSSSFDKWGFLLTNSQGIIDNGFSSNIDIWGANILPTRNAVIGTDKAILQFRIMLSQKATLWQRIKWLFSSGKIEFVEVSNLENEPRGGFGSTDVECYCKDRIK